MSPAGALVGKVAMVVGAVGLAGGVTYAATRTDDAPTGQEVVTGAPDAWIDAPLHGAVITEGTVEVVAHAASPAGIVRIDLSVAPTGGGEADEQSADTGGGALELATFAWTPPEPGAYVVSVHGTDGDGNPTSTAQATVEVVAGTGTTAGTIPKLELGTTSTSSTSSTTSSTSTTTSTPTTVRPTTPSTAPTTQTTRPAPPVCVKLTSPADGSWTTDKTPRLTWQVCGGNPAELVVQVGTDPSFVTVDVEEAVGGNVRYLDVPDPLPCSTSYYWRVGAGGTWSDAWRFDLVCT